MKTATAGPKQRRRADGAPLKRTRSGVAWRRDPAGRKERLLSAASKLFGIHGYATVTTAMIADAAGVSEGIIYHYYRSKPALLREVAARYGRGFADAMFSGTSPADAVPPPEAVIRRAFAYVRFSDPSFGLFLLSDGPGDSGAAKQANREAVVARLGELFEIWKRRGDIAAIDSRILAALCFGLVEAGLRECYSRGTPSSEVEESYVNEVSRCIRAMLGVA